MNIFLLAATPRRVLVPGAGKRSRRCYYIACRHPSGLMKPTIQTMNRRRALILAAGILLVAGSVWLLWSHLTAPRPFRLKAVRHSILDGHPVVYFRVFGGSNRRFWIPSFATAVVPFAGLTDLSTNSPPDFDFWTPTTKSIGDGYLRPGIEFPVRVPTVAQCWRLRLGIYPEVPVWERLHAMPSTWTDAKKRTGSVLKATSYAWNLVYEGSMVMIESEWLTNTVTSSR